jgi:hypothetical protein
MAKSNIIVFADSDLIMNPNEFIEGLKMLEQYEMINPYKSVVDLNAQETGLPLDTIIKIDRPGRGETDHQKVPICGGICMFRKQAIDKIAGWIEQFIVGGAEDDFVSLKVQHFLNWKQMDYKCFHLFHNREQPNMQEYQKNLQLLDHFAKLSKEDFMKILHRDVQKNGMKNKYD